MSPTMPSEVRAMLLNVLNRRLKDFNREPMAELPDEFDLMGSGVIESL